VTRRPSQVIYIAGSGRSGSTLVERTLGDIPGWVNVGELIELFRKPSVATELCGCGRSFAACEFWSEVGRLAFDSWSPETFQRIGTLQQRVSRQRYLPQLLLARVRTSASLSSAMREYGEFYRRLYNAIADVAGADVVVDSSKWPGQALALQRLNIPISLFHLVRDPRGVAYSWSKAEVARPHGGEGSVMAAHGAGATALRWTAFQTEIAIIRPNFSRSTRMRYEDFVSDPSGRLRAALRDLGLDRYNDRLSHVHRNNLELSQSHGIAGNPSRFNHGVVRLRLDDAWKDALPRADRIQVTALAAPWLMRLGYPLKAA
jgi:Sulfotransferase family